MRRRMMKKLIAGTLMLAFMLTGCGDSDENGNAAARMFNKYGGSDTEEGSEQGSTAPTASIATTEEATEAQKPDIPWKEIYRAFLEKKDFLKMGQKYGPEEEIQVGLYDVDGDDIPELLVECWDNMGDNGEHLYLYSCTSGTVEYLGEGKGGSWALIPTLDSTAKNNLYSGTTVYGEDDKPVRDYYRYEIRDHKLTIEHVDLQDSDEVEYISTNYIDNFLLELPVLDQLAEMGKTEEWREGMRRFLYAGAYWLAEFDYRTDEPFPMGGVYNFDVYPIDPVLYDGDGDEKDPKGRFSDGSFYKLDGQKTDWILKNVYNCSDKAIEKMHNIDTGEEYSEYYQKGAYYTFPYSLCGNVGVIVVIEDISELNGFYKVVYSNKRYHYNGELVDEAKRYAVLEEKELDGKKFWSMYSSTEKAPGNAEIISIEKKKPEKFEAVDEPEEEEKITGSITGILPGGGYATAEDALNAYMRNIQNKDYSSILRDLSDEAAEAIIGNNKRTAPKLPVTTPAELREWAVKRDPGPNGYFSGQGTFYEWYDADFKDVMKSWEIIKMESLSDNDTKWVKNFKKFTNADEVAAFTVSCVMVVDGSEVTLKKEKTDRVDNRIFFIRQGNKWSPVKPCWDISNMISMSSYCWTQSYIGYLQRHNYDQGEAEFALIYLDNDDVPELFIRVWEMETWELLTSDPENRSGKAEYGVNAEKDIFGGISYIERSGIFHEHMAQSGDVGDTIMSCQDGVYTMLYSGRGMSYFDDDTFISEYAWEGQDVSEEEYNNLIEKCYDKDKSTEPELKYTYDELVECLEKW